MQKIQQLRVVFRLNLQKPKNNTFPIYLRVFLDGRKFELSTGLYIDPIYWDQKLSKVKSKHTNYDLINNKLNLLATKIHREFLTLSSKGDAVELNQLRDACKESENTPKLKTIQDAFEYHNIKMREQVAADIVVSRTFQRYVITQNKVMAFIKKQYKKTDMPLEEMRMRFITEFEHYLLTTDQLQSNTAHKYIKNLKKIMNLAVSLDWIPSNPFNNFRCSYTAPNREVLTQEEIDHIRFKDFGTDRLNEVRDVFIFCCYSGFAYADVHELRTDNILKGVDGNLWITTSRKKTGTRESVPMLPIPFEIIERYKTHKYCIKYDKLLPVNSNQNYNAYLKEIAAVCGINKTLTSHIARHTFATTITLANGVPIETVSAMLGHNSIKTTQIYAKVLEQKVSTDMEQLKSKLFGVGTPARQREG